MHVDFLKNVFEENDDQEFLIWQERSFTYGWLLARLEHWGAKLAREGIQRGEVVVVEADYTPNTIALFLALVEQAAIMVPLSHGLKHLNGPLVALSRAMWSFKIQKDEELKVQKLTGDGHHSLYEEINRRGHPGLVVFSSGSTGESKGAVHDLMPILEKFRVRRHRMRTIPFLLFDHLGGLNTMLYCLSNGGCMVAVNERTPDSILAAVARHRIELLPTSPTFLHLMLLSEAYNRHDLASLRTISYGTEPMPASTLKRLHELFPNIRLLQTYGLSELGVLRSRSRDSDSLWVKLGGEGFEWRVVDGLLEIKAKSAMLGYLNAPSPYTEDGWFRTQDEVEVDGEYLRILGRHSDLINVGGEKVYPAPVESVIMELEEVSDATVYGEDNPITGQIVCVDVVAQEGYTEPELLDRIWKHCHGRLKRHEFPLKLQIKSKVQFQERFKKDRRIGATL